MNAYSRKERCICKEYRSMSRFIYRTHTCKVDQIDREDVKRMSFNQKDVIYSKWHRSVRMYSNSNDFVYIQKDVLQFYMRSFIWKDVLHTTGHVPFHADVMQFKNMSCMQDRNTGNCNPQRVSISVECGAWKGNSLFGPSTVRPNQEIMPLVQYATVQSGWWRSSLQSCTKQTTRFLHVV